MANIEEKVETLIAPKIKDLGYELYDVEYVKEGKDYFLRVFIDSKNGIDLQDCEKVSGEINDILDEADYIKEQYFLEISSPGVERTLRKERHLEQNIGKEIVINLYKPINNSKQIEGILSKFDNENIYLEDGNIVDRKNISLIKIKFEW